MLALLKTRFEANRIPRARLSWAIVAARLEAHPEALAALQWMEESGGEPDVIGIDGEQILFADCARESPAGRRSLCYDETARRARKKAPPADSAEEQAARHGISLMTEQQYRFLQTLGEFDLKTSSWIAAPKEVRDLGGALFCERRYGRVFVFHNSADSYYGVRGWRGIVSV